MALDLAFEEVLRADEITTMLKITEGDLTDLESKGLPFIEVNGKHFYLASSMTTFFKKVETNFKKETQDGMG